MFKHGQGSPAPTPPRPGLDLGTASLGDIRGGRPSSERVSSAHPRPSRILPASLPRHAEGSTQLCPSWRKDPLVPEASPSSQAGHIGPPARAEQVGSTNPQAAGESYASCPPSQQKAIPSHLGDEQRSKQHLELGIRKPHPDPSPQPDQHHPRKQ